MQHSADNAKAPPVPPGLVLEHPSSLELLARLNRIAVSGAPVLLLGETGTGKELFAREVHARSARARQSFVAVNAGALSEQLVEGELFGHEKGAFTGAHERKPGWFEAADGGTLFLDEIGDLPLPLQVKLLRVLSAGEVTRLGSRTPTRVDVRIVAATNVDLQAAMRERRFREDLYYRLSVATLRLPPLRERPGDILPIARHLLARFACLGARGLQLGAEAEQALLRHTWPGNVRELENVIQQAAIECAGSEVRAEHLGLGVAVREVAREVAGDEAPGLSAAPVSEVVVREPLCELVAPTPAALERLASRAIAGRSAPCRSMPALAGETPSSRRASPNAEAVPNAEMPSWPDSGHGVLVLPRRASVGEEAALASLGAALDSLLACAVPDLHSRVEGALLSAAFRRAGQNQLETARLLGLSRHVARARLIEHGQLPVHGRRGSRGAASEPRLLRIGYQNLGLLMLVKAYGAFDAALGSRNVSIVWREYAGGIQIVDALGRGELDLGVVGDYPAVYAQAEAMPVVYVASEPPAPRGAALIVPRGSALRSVGDLRGRRVAVNRAAQAHYLLMLALEEAGLGLDDIELCFEPPAGALAAFQSGAIDAWAIWDPWLSSARIDLGARVLRDTSGLFESSVYYLARQRFTETDADLVNELRTQLEVAARWVESDPGRAAHLIAPRLGFSARALEASLDRELGRIGVTPGQLAAQQRIADQCLRLRLIPRPVSVAAAQWPHALAG